MPEPGGPKNEEGSEGGEPIIGSPPTGKWVFNKNEQAFRFSEATKEYVALTMEKEIRRAKSLSSLSKMLRERKCIKTAGAVNEVKYGLDQLIDKQAGLSKSANVKEIIENVLEGSDLFVQSGKEEVDGEEIDIREVLKDKLTQLIKEEIKSRL